MDTFLQETSQSGTTGGISAETNSGKRRANPIDETLSHPNAVTLDECLRRAPKSLTERDLDHMITILRAERAAFEIKAEKRDAKRQGIEEEEEADEPAEDTPAPG